MANLVSRGGSCRSEDRVLGPFFSPKVKQVALTDPMPEPLSQEDQELVRKKLERRQEILDLLSELGSKRPRPA